jgi:hypothetical protein
VLLERTVAEQRFTAVVEVVRDGLTVTEVAERYGGATHSAGDEVSWDVEEASPLALQPLPCERPQRHPIRRGSRDG